MALISARSSGAEWLEARQTELPPVPYYHVVFTLSRQAAEIASQNKRLVYAVLFRAAAEALREIAADPRHLGAEVGAVAVLHTWVQTLLSGGTKFPNLAG